jgi:hypothetical protein
MTDDASSCCAGTAAIPRHAKKEAAATARATPGCLELIMLKTPAMLSFPD